MLTSPSNIFSRDPGSNYDLTVDDAAMATSIQNALNTQAQYGAGTSAERTAALSQFMNGAIWYDTTTSSEWRKVGGSWVNQDTGWVTGSVPSGWTPSASANHGYRVKDGYCTVAVGIEPSGSYGGGTLASALTLPANARPDSSVPDIWFIAMAGASTMRARLFTTSGAINVYSVPSGTSTLVANATFPVRVS